MPEWFEKAARAIQMRPAPLAANVIISAVLEAMTV
jgi:hypothetical protein